MSCSSPVSVSVRCPLCMGYYRAAIALNNAAMNMLVCGFYLQAVETIKAAINLMKDTAERQNGVIDGSEMVSEADIRQRLEVAWERVAACRKQSAADPTGAPADDPIVLKVVSSEYDPARLYAALSTAINNSNVKFPMTIDCIDSISEESAYGGFADVDFYSSVLLYNYGIAYDCLAASTITDTSDGCSTQVALQRNAYRIKQLAYHILCIHQFMTETEEESNFFTIGRRLQLETFLTHSLIQACVQLGVAHQDQYQNLEDVLLLIDERERVFPTTEHHCARAA